MSTLRKQMDAAPGVPSDVEVAGMFEDVALPSKRLQDIYDCETTRIFAQCDVAAAYAARVVIAMLATTHVRGVTMSIMSPDDSHNGHELWAVAVGGDDVWREGADPDRGDVQHEDVACVASAVLASGDAAACDWCSHPTEAVQQVRAALRRLAPVLYSLERTITAKIKTGATYTATFTRGWILREGAASGDAAAYVLGAPQCDAFAMLAQEHQGCNTL